MNADDAWQEFKKAVVSERAVKKASVSEKLDVISAQLVQNQAKMDELDGKIDSISAPSDDGGMGAGAPPAPGGMPGGGLAALLGGMGGGAPPGGEEQGGSPEEGGGQGVPPMAGAAGPGKEAFQASATKKKLRSRSSIAKDSFAQSAIGMTSGEEKKQALIDQLLETLKDEPRNQKLIEVLNAERSQSNSSKKKSIAKALKRGKRNTDSNPTGILFNNHWRDQRILGKDSSVIYIMSRLFPNISGRGPKWGYKLIKGTDKIEPIDQTGKSKKEYEDECTNAFYEQYNCYMDSYRSNLERFRTTVEGQTYSIMERLKDLTTYFNQKDLYYEVKKRRDAFIKTPPGLDPPEGSMNDAAMVNFMDRYVHEINHIISNAYESNKIIKNPCTKSDTAILAKKYASGKLSTSILVEAFRMAQAHNGGGFWELIPSILLNAGSKGLTPILANPDAYLEPPVDIYAAEYSDNYEEDHAAIVQRFRAQQWRQVCNMLASAQDYLVTPSEFADYLVLAKKYGLDNEGDIDSDMPQDNTQAEDMLALKDHPIIKKAAMSMYILNNLATDGEITRMVKELKADLSSMSGRDLDYVESVINQCATDMSNSGGVLDQEELLKMLTGEISPEVSRKVETKATTEQCLNLLVAVLGDPPERLSGSVEMQTKWRDMQLSAKSKINNIVKKMINDYNTAVEGLFAYVTDAKEQGYDPHALTELQEISDMDKEVNIKRSIDRAISNGKKYTENEEGKIRDLEEISQNLDKVSYDDGTIGEVQIERYLERYGFEIPPYSTWATVPPSKSQMTRSSIEKFNKIPEPLRGIVKNYMEGMGITLDVLPHDALYHNILGLRSQRPKMPKSGMYKLLQLKYNRRDRITEMNYAIKNRLDFMRCLLGYDSIYNRKYNLDSNTVDDTPDNLFVRKAIEAIKKMDKGATYDGLRAHPEADPSHNTKPPEISNEMLLDVLRSSPPALSAFLTACAYHTDNPDDYLPEQIKLGGAIPEPEWKIRLKTIRNLAALDGYLMGSSRDITHVWPEDPMWDDILSLREKIELNQANEKPNRPRPYEFFQNYEPDNSLFNKLETDLTRNSLARSNMKVCQETIALWDQEIDDMQFNMTKMKAKKHKEEIHSELLHAFEIAIYMNLLQGQPTAGAIRSALEQVGQTYTESLIVSRHDADNQPIKIFDLDTFRQMFYDSPDGIIQDTLEEFPNKFLYTDDYLRSWWLDTDKIYVGGKTHDQSLANILGLQNGKTGWYNTPETRAATEILRAKANWEQLGSDLSTIERYLKKDDKVSPEAARGAYVKVRGIWGSIVDRISRASKDGLDQATRKLLETGVIKTDPAPLPQSAVGFFNSLMKIMDMKNPNGNFAQNIKDAFGNEWEDYVKNRRSLKNPKELDDEKKKDLDKSVSEYESKLKSLGIDNVDELYNEFADIVQWQDKFDATLAKLTNLGVTQVDISRENVPENAKPIVKEYRKQQKKLTDLKADWDKKVNQMIDDSLNIRKSKKAAMGVRDAIYYASKYEKEMNKYAKEFIDLRGAVLPIRGFDGITIGDDSDGGATITKEELLKMVKQCLANSGAQALQIPKGANAGTQPKAVFEAILPAMVHAIINYQKLSNETARADESDDPDGKIKGKKKETEKKTESPKDLGNMWTDDTSPSSKWYENYSRFANQKKPKAGLNIYTGRKETIGDPELIYNEEAVSMMRRILDPLANNAKKYFERVHEMENSVPEEPPNGTGNKTPGNKTLRNKTPGKGKGKNGKTSEGTPDKGTPDKGTPDKGTPDKGTPDKGTPGNKTPGKGKGKNGKTSEGTPDKGTPGNNGGK